MRLFIAEKPSLAKEIAFTLAQMHNMKADMKDGYWDIDSQTRVTWLFGHMLEQAYPEEYDEKYSKWNVNDLPIIPEKWKLNPIKDKKDHIKKIKALLKDASEVVNAGDAAREGQLLVDELLIELGWNPFTNKTLRLWVQSVARADLIKAIKSMKTNADKENLYKSALARSRSDWLHGLNLTRLYTVRANIGQTLSVGRVQTPTLRLIVDRDNEIDNFKSIDHYLPTGEFKHANGVFTASWVIPEDCNGLDAEGRLIDKNIAQSISEKISGKTGKISDYSSQDKSNPAPLPYSLSALQADCSAKFGLSAKDTLEVAQALYETHKLTTYPRSDSRYLPTAIYKDEAPKIIKGLGDIGDYKNECKNADLTIKSSAWNDGKISDHHGIIPTTEVSSEKYNKLSDKEKKVFDLIARTFIAQFYPPFRYKSLSTLVLVADETFKATGTKVAHMGWKAVFSSQETEDDDDGQTLPEMKKSDPVDVLTASVDAKKTKPPARFTDGTLITAMSNVHRFVSDPEIKKRLKDNDGLGTEATRAQVLETLLTRKFISRKGKQLISTDMGKSLIATLPDEITNPGLTAVWETYLERIAQGTLPFDAFMNEQHKILHKRIKQGIELDMKIEGGKRPTVPQIEGHGESCPACGKGSLVTRVISKGDHKGKSFLGCSNYPECSHSVFPDRKPKAEGHGKDCPKCNEGKLVTRTSKKGTTFLGCNNYPKCDAIEWIK